MSSSYDEALLRSAPPPTKTQLQDGYNSDLLEKTSIPTTPALDPEAARLTPVQPQSEEALSLDKKRVPFYSTKKGIIILVVVAAVIVIAAVVGGAVGGTRKKKPTAGGKQGDGIASTSTSTTARPSSSTHSDPSPSPAPPATQGTGSGSSG